MSYNPNYGQQQYGQQQPQQWGAYPPNQGGYTPLEHPNPGYSAPYAPPQQPPPQAYGNGYGNEKDPYANGRFKPEKKINDIVFLILYVATFLGFAGLSGYVLHTFAQENGLGGKVGSSKGTNGTKFSLNEHTVYLLLFVTAGALLLSTIWLMLVRAFTRAIMHVTLVLSIVLNIALCAYYWITRYYSAAIVFTIIAIVSVLSYWGMRSRIPLSSLLLQVVMDISKHHMSVYVVGFATLIIQAAISVWFVFTAIATYTTYTPGNPACSQGKSCSSGKVAGMIFFETFAYLWISQVIGNVSLATLAGGPYGAWYYFGPKGQGSMPNHPTTSAFVRASTRSLGSIAFGSLIVAILELIRLILRAIRDNAADDGNIVGMICACCAECIVGCIEGMVEYFNRYAYIEIALYGKAYIPAAKDTWRLFTDRGIDALVNDSLVAIVIQWGAYVVGGLCSLFAYLYLRYTHPAYNANGDYTVPVVLFSFLIGAQCLLTLGSSIEAGVSTIFVGLGEDPQILAIRAPELFGMIAQFYPQVTTGVQH